MHEVRRRSLALTWQQAKPVWLPLDVLVLSTNALLGLAVWYVGPRLAHAHAYLALHLATAAAVYLLAKRDDQRAQPFDPWTFVHNWLPAVFVMVMYFELGLLIPHLRSYGDHHYDRALQAVDVWLLGEPVAAISSIASAPLSDFLTVCYIAYYPLAIAVPLAAYVRGTLDEYQRVAAIVLTAFLISYAGYVAWPALGPHRLYDLTRPAALDGYGFARIGYAFFRGVPNEPPDAFPSGHALIGVLAPALAFRYYRPLCVWLAPVGLGCIMATVYLRYHYIADVLAAFALAPVCWRLGSVVERRFRGPIHEPATLQEAPESTA
jgi:hypothetical protein